MYGHGMEHRLDHCPDPLQVQVSILREPWRSQQLADGKGIPTTVGNPIALGLFSTAQAQINVIQCLTSPAETGNAGLIGHSHMVKNAAGLLLGIS